MQYDVVVFETRNQPVPSTPTIGETLRIKKVIGRAWDVGEGSFKRVVVELWALPIDGKLILEARH